MGGGNGETGRIFYTVFYFLAAMRTGEKFPADRLAACNLMSILPCGCVISIDRHDSA